MHRFYIPPNEWDPLDLILRGSEAHHARDVLRLGRGDKAVVFNGRGREITAEIIEPRKDKVFLRKLHEAQTLPLRCRITLAQAIPKGKNMELIVQKAVEIGASQIAPLISERTIVDLGSKEAEQKQTKWQQIAIEAAKQSGQNWLPQVDVPRKLKDFFATTVSLPSDCRPLISDLCLIGSLQSDARRLKEVLVDHAKVTGGAPRTVLMLIGPEGDFTPAELNVAKSHGCQPITLGPIILRVETAAIYCLSVLSYELL